MSYPNEFLGNFRPVYLGILKAKGVMPERAKLELIDEEPEGAAVFEQIGVLDVLLQLENDLNFLTIYTARPAYFQEFTETMYEKNGLIVRVFPKKRLKLQRAGEGEEFLFDFEWQGTCYEGQICRGRHYIPIHKRPWETAENLDIRVPIGYNTVIVKRQQKKRKKPRRDRFEEAFYSS